MQKLRKGVREMQEKGGEINRQTKTERFDLGKKMQCNIKFY